MQKCRFYFVGGPKEGHREEFFRLLGEAGGPPDGWSIYPHASGDGKALHVVEAESAEEVIGHIDIFKDIYEMSEIVEVIDVPK